MDAITDIVIPQRDSPTTFQSITINGAENAGRAIGFGVDGRLGAIDDKIEMAVNSIVGLKAIDVGGLEGGERVEMLGYYAAADGGGGSFWFNEALVAEDNGGTIIKPTALDESEPGRWVRLCNESGAINARWFGAGLGQGDDSPLLANAVAATPAGGTLLMPSGIPYRLSTTLACDRAINIQGAGTVQYAIGTQIYTTLTFPAGADLIQFNVPSCSIRDIYTHMELRGGTWLAVTNFGEHQYVERCMVESVAAGYWGIELRSSHPHGVALMSIIDNYFLDFEGGGIWGHEGGDSCQIIHNRFQLINSDSHILLWDGSDGAACLNFSENNCTGASKFIQINLAAQVKITKNQCECGTELERGCLAMIKIVGPMQGAIIESNNFWGQAKAGFPNGITAIALDNVWDTLIINNSISGFTNSITTTALTHDILYVKGTDTVNTFVDLGNCLSRIYTMAGGGVGIAKSLLVDGGTLGVKSNPTSTMLGNFGGPVAGGTGQYGVVAQPIIGSDGTSSGSGIYTNLRTAAAAFICAAGHGIQVAAPGLGAGSGVTNLYGIRVNNQGAAGVTNAYGIFIAVQSGAGTANIGLYNQGTTTLLGKVSTNSTATDPAINIGAVAGNPSSLVNGDIWYNSATGQLMGKLASGSVVLGGGAEIIDFTASDPSAVPTGKVKGFMVCPYAGTITGWSIVVDAGTATVKVWKIASGTAKPTVANVINTTGLSLASGTAVVSAVVSDFTTVAVAANDIFAVEITAASGVKEITFQLKITKT